MRVRLLYELLGVLAARLLASSRLKRMTETTDFLIIGGGVIGCAVAYELSKARANAILVERGEIGQEASSASAGMLSPLLESDSEDTFSRLCHRGRSLFPDYLEELRERTGQQIEFHHQGRLDIPMSEEEAIHLQERKYSVGGGTRLLSRHEVQDMEPHVQLLAEPAVYSPDPAHLDNARYTSALAAGCKSRRRPDAPARTS